MGCYLEVSTLSAVLWVVIAVWFNPRQGASIQGATSGKNMVILINFRLCIEVFTIFQYKCCNTYVSFQQPGCVGPVGFGHWPEQPRLTQMIMMYNIIIWFIMCDGAVSVV